METNFTTKLNSTLDIDVYGLESYLNRSQNHDIEAVAVIDWGVYLDIREWGVKSINFTAHKVAIELTINWWNDDDSVEQKTLIIETEHASDDDWRITEDIYDLNIGNYFIFNEIAPQSLELNFDTKEITIKF